MPYSGPGDPDLPEHVKKLPEGKRAQWVEVFNSVMERCEGERKECEGKAFAQANGVVKKEVSYYDRNQLAQLAGLFASRLGYNVGIVQDKEHPVLLIDLPDVGQISYSMPEDEIGTYFSPYDGQWDGHSDHEKRRRICAYLGGKDPDEVPDFEEKVVGDAPVELSGTLTTTASTAEVITITTTGTGTVYVPTVEEKGEDLDPAVDDEEEDDEEEDDEEEMIEDACKKKPKKKGFWDSLKEHIVAFFKDYEGPLDEPQQKKGRYFYTIKQDDGTGRWVMISSTAFLDRDQEIVSRKALAGLPTEKEAGKDFGPLVFWHTKVGPEEYLALGSCDTRIVDDAVMVESGLWNNTPLAKAVQSDTEERPDFWGASIAFWANSQDIQPNVVVNGQVVKNVYDKIDIVERSLLPTQNASNRFTYVVNGGSMDQAKRGLLAQLVDESTVKEIESRVDDLNAKAANDPEAVIKEATPAPVAEPTPPAEKPEEKETPAAVAKEITDSFAALQAQLAELANEVKAIKEQNAPRGALHRATQDSSNVVSNARPVPAPNTKVVDGIAEAILKNLGGTNG